VLNRSVNEYIDICGWEYDLVCNDGWTAVENKVGTTFISLLNSHEYRVFHCPCNNISSASNRTVFYCDTGSIIWSHINPGDSQD